MAGTHEDLVRRKIGAAQARKLELSMQGVIADSLQLAVIKSATGLRGIALQGMVESCDVVSLEAMLEALPTTPLIAVIERRDDGVQGLCALDPDLVNNLVEVLTGTVAVTGAERIERPYTGVDAALCSQFVDVLTERFREALGEALGSDFLRHFRYARYETGTAPLEHVMERVTYAVFVLALDIGEDGRTGALQLVLPAGIFEAIDEDEIARSSGADRAEQALWQDHMEAVLGDTAMALNAVLERMMLPLGLVCDLRVGDVLDLPDGSLAEIAVELAAPAGPIVMARGRLGQFAGRKVVKVTNIGGGGGEPALLAAPPEPGLDGVLAVDGVADLGTV